MILAMVTFLLNSCLLLFIINGYMMYDIVAFCQCFLYTVDYLELLMDSTPIISSYYMQNLCIVRKLSDRRMKAG